MLEIEIRAIESALNAAEIRIRESGIAYKIKEIEAFKQAYRSLQLRRNVKHFAAA